MFCLLLRKRRPRERWYSHRHQLQVGTWGPVAETSHRHRLQHGVQLSWVPALNLFFEADVGSSTSADNPGAVCPGLKRSAFLSSSALLV